MVEVKQKQKIVAWMFAGMIVCLCVGFILGSGITEMQNEKDNYCIPKGNAGVYYNLQDTVAITVLDLKDTNQAQIVSQLDSIFKNLKGGN